MNTHKHEAHNNPRIRHFDLAIIGSGSGNTILSEKFDSLDIAMIEKGIFGGTCLNVGCIPTKMFVFPADIIREAQDIMRLGIDTELTQVHWEELRNRIFHRIDSISAGGLRYRQEDCSNITVFQGEASFLPSPEQTSLDQNATQSRPYYLKIGEETISTDKIIIAAGSRPHIPTAIASSDVEYYTNENIMRLPELPEHLIIVGSGYIAAEFAHVFSSLGSKVSVIARHDKLLRSQDNDISTTFTELACKKWNVIFHSSIEKVHQHDEGITINLQDGRNITGSHLLVAAGRTPNGDTLDIENIGLKLDAEGRIPVDQYQRTSAINVYALGDVSSSYQLKHVANHEAKVVQHNVLQDFTDTTSLHISCHDAVPAAIFTYPQIASVGLTEHAVQQREIPYVVKIQKYSDIAYGWAMEDEHGFCKVLAHKESGQLLGVHILGYQASVLIQTAVTAMAFNIDAVSMARKQYWTHPALSELLENAFLGLLE